MNVGGNNIVLYIIPLDYHFLSLFLAMKLNVFRASTGCGVVPSVEMKGVKVKDATKNWSSATNESLKN